VNDKYRLAYLATHPIQYQAPLLRRLSAHPQIDLTAFFMSDLSVGRFHATGFDIPLTWDVPLLDGYRHVFLPALGRNDQLSFWRPWVYGLRGCLKGGRFDALWLHGYAHHVSLCAIALAKSLGIKVLVRGEAHLLTGTDFGLWGRAWQRIVPKMFSLADGFLAIGTLNRQYYAERGVASNRIFMMPYAVDNEFFSRHAKEAHSRRDRFRSELGLGAERPVILYASKLQSHKRPHDLLEAYIRMSPDGVREPSPYLLFVGDGKERASLEARARSLGWASVRFLGFRNQTELPAFYDLCDVFVLPSAHEPWGLVVNEVMNAGKAVVVSDRVGAGPDLVTDGENGFVVPAGDVHALADRLTQIISRPQLALAMGEASLRKVANWDFGADERGLTRALGSVVKR
jgi:glycosyltransferase involved in cell wall biosynthesis